MTTNTERLEALQQARQVIDVPGLLHRIVVLEHEYLKLKDVSDTQSETIAALRATIKAHERILASSQELIDLQATAVGMLKERLPERNPHRDYIKVDDEHIIQRTPKGVYYPLYLERLQPDTDEYDRTGPEIWCHYYSANYKVKRFDSEEEARAFLAKSPPVYEERQTKVPEETAPQEKRTRRKR
jgi:hypothetical protein